MDRFVRAGFESYEITGIVEGLKVGKELSVTAQSDDGKPRTTDLRPWLWGLPFGEPRNVNARTHVQGDLWFGVKLRNLEWHGVSLRRRDWITTDRKVFLENGSQLFTRAYAATPFLSLTAW